MSEPLRARAMTIVRIPPDEAFEVFTTEIDLWWRHGPRFRPAIDGRLGEMRFEPKEGGRLLEVYADGESFELGRVRDWEPGVRLAFGMGGRDFAPGEFTEVEVRFEEAHEGTRVTIEHWGFEELGPDHGVRHGQGDEALIGSTGLWWGDTLVALRAYAEARAPGR